MVADHLPHLRTEERQENQPMIEKEELERWLATLPKGTLAADDLSAYLEVGGMPDEEAYCL